MRTPTVHLNGTKGQDLLESYLKAVDKLRDAIQAVMNAYPNGRDLYTQEPGAYQVAVVEQQERLEKLTEVKKEMEMLAEAVADQI